MDRRSERNLIGVDDRLQMVVIRAFELFGDAVTKLPGARMVITDGVRTPEQQAEYVAAGRSWTMNSRHLTGHAIDFAIIHRGAAVWELPVFERVWLGCFRPAGHFLDVPLAWGGDWSTRDGPHVEIPR